MVRVVSILLVLVLTTRAASGEPPPVTLTLSAHFGSAPITLRLRSMVEPDARNRVLCFSAYEEDSPEPVRRTCYDLNGEASPRFHEIEWRRVDAGDYVVRAEVIRLDRGKQTAVFSAPVPLTVSESLPGR